MDAEPAGLCVKPLRVWLAGFGTVGQWLAGALVTQVERLAGRYGVDVAVVGLSNGRDGFVYDGDGLDLASALGLVSAGRSIAEQPGVRLWSSTIEGLRATEADLLVEVTASPSTEGEPGLAHMREALRRGIPVVTSNKWPVALRGVELVELARSRGVPFRAESTVMSGTPVLSALVDGLAGAVPVALRGLLNATDNFILSRTEIDKAASSEARLKHVATLDFSEPDGDWPRRSVGDRRRHHQRDHQPSRSDRTVTIIGPGARPQLAGQGVLSDLIAVARSRTGS